ncbi:MAG: hypothetical protein Q8S26_15575 [Azonexus sp.]|nr:hypothetical protein [Azonexus sp.]
MTLVDEKRNGPERRFKIDGPPSTGAERRGAMERRQTAMAEISFFEWASHFVSYQGKAISSAVDHAVNEAAEVLNRAKGR